MEKELRACSFTGHRNIPDEHTAALTDLLRRAIEYLYREGVRDFYSGGALGFDTLAARAVLLFRMAHPDVRLHVLIPCKDQTKSWTQRQIDAYCHMLSQADTVEYLSDEYTPGCMRERNAALVERADVVVAYMSRSRSGAGQTVRMAQSCGRTVYNLYPSVCQSLGGKD